MVLSGIMPAQQYKAIPPLLICRWMDGKRRLSHILKHSLVHHSPPGLRPPLLTHLWSPAVRQSTSSWSDLMCRRWHPPPDRYRRLETETEVKTSPTESKLPFKLVLPSLYAATISRICLLFLDASTSIRHLSFVPTPWKQRIKLNMQ